MTYLLIGLGNPGDKYQNTRHNFGFMTLDQLKNHYKFSDWKDSTKLKSQISKGKINNHKILAAKPQTFMNNSGEAVRAILDYYKLDINNLLIISDDLDLPFGTTRIRQKGSSGGHNGLKSIIENLKTENFCRLKLGIRNEFINNTKDFVLSKFSKDEQDELENIIKEGIMKIEELAELKE